MDHRTPPGADGDLPAPASSGGGGGAAPGGLGAAAAAGAGGAAPAPLQAVGRLSKAMGEAVGAVSALWTLTGDQLVAVLEAKQALAAQLDAIGLAAVREVDSRGHHLQSGAASTGAWLSHHLLIDRHTAAADVAAARALDPDGDLPPAPGTNTAAPGPAAVALAATGRALLAGEVSRAHADAIRSSITRLGVPSLTLTPVERDHLHARAESVLLAECDRLTPAQVRTAGTHLRHLVDPDGVLTDERTAQQRASFWLKPDPDGASYRFGGTTDPVTAAQLTTFIDAHCAPRPSVDDTGTPTPDPRTPDQRRGAAFTDLVHLASNADPAVCGGLSTQLVVTTTLTTLQSQLGERGVLCATTETGQPLSAATTRRLACDTTVIPLVLGAASEPLDVGRATRTIPTAIRRALNHRDRHCAFPSCTRPPQWADAHHIHHWADGGTTSLDNLVLLCGHHHDLIHHTDWTVKVINGRPRFTPPLRT